MNQLLEAGHSKCHLYPIAMLYSEHTRLVRRHNSAMATEAILIQAAIGSVVSGGDHFKKIVEDLTNG